MSVPPITFQAAWSTQITGPALTVPIPAGAQAGDAILLAIAPSARPSGIPDGWTTLIGTPYYYYGQAVYAHVVTAAEAANPATTWSFTWESSAYISAAYASYRGCLDLRPVHYSSSSHGSSLRTNHVNPAISTEHANPPLEPRTKVIRIWVGGAGAYSFTAPAETTTRVNLAGGATHKALLLVDEDADACGEVPSRTATTATNRSSLWAIIGLLYPVADCALPVYGDLGGYGIAYQQKCGRLYYRRYNPDDTLIEEVLVATPEPWTRSVRLGSIMENPRWPSGALELVLERDYYLEWSYQFYWTRYLSRDDGHTWEALGEVEAPLFRPAPFGGKWVSAWRDDTSGRYVTVFGSPSGSSYSGITGVYLIGPGYAVGNGAYAGMATLRSHSDPKSCRMRGHRDGTFSHCIEIYDGISYTWKIVRCRALPCSPTGAEEWSVWATVDPGWTVGTMDYWLSEDGLLVCVLLKWPDMEWYVYTAMLDASGTSWTWGTPVAIQVGGGNLAGQWAQPSLRRRRDGVWELAYTPRVDVADPSVPALIRCRALASDGTGVWE